MGLSFLAPLVLAALAAIAIPILVHLTNRPRERVLAFPSLMFLQRVQYRTVRRQTIRHWILFLLRASVIVLVVAAFARPLLEGSGADVIAAGGRRDLVIALDQSMSMAYGDRWERAVAAAREAVASLGPDDRATLVLFDDRAARAGSSDGAGGLEAALAEARPTAAPTRYASGLSVARDLLQEATRPRREVLLISDFQRGGWRGDEDLRLPPGTQFTFEDVSDGATENLAVVGLAVERSRESGRERVTISARLANPGSRAAGDVPVHLEVDGQRVGSRQVDLAARGAGIAQFDAIALSDRPVRVTARLGRADPLATDDAQHAVVAPAQPVRVLLVSDDGVFLRRALSLGSDPPFAVTRRTAQTLSGADLAGQTVVLLDDVPAPPSGVVQRLSGLVEAGGGLLVALGRRSAPEGWQARGATLLGGIAGTVVDRLADHGARLSGLGADHPAFEIFRAPRSGDVSTARFFRYRTFRPGNGAAILARFDDGGVALTERTLGRGRVVAFTSGLDNGWNDLPVQPVFLPFVHQLVEYLAGYQPPRLSYTVGEVLDVRQWAGELSIETPSGLRVASGGRDAAVPHELRESGLYTLRLLERGQEPVAVAVNPDPAESDLTRMDPAELARRISADPSAPVPGPTGEALSAPERERRQGLWWYILLAVLLLLVAETLTSNRLTVRRSPS